MSTELITPRTRELLRQLELQARTITSGLRYGLHRSKRRGVSSDFLHHRGYNVGDPLKHLDWKVYARTERHYVKLFVEDSTMRLWGVVDYSASMDSEPEVRQTDKGEVPLPEKWEFAARLVAAMCCLAIEQQDQAGLMVSGAEVQSFPPSSTPSQLGLLCHGLATAARSGDADLVAALRMVEENARPGATVVVASDLSFAPEPTRKVIGSMRARGHDVVVFHVMSPLEEEFAFNRWVDFRCVERGSDRYRVDATLLRAIYRDEVERFFREWTEFCRKQRVDFVRARTDANIVTLLDDYLRRRAAGE